MSPDFLRKWEHLLDDVEKTEIPLQFIKKLVIRLHGNRQRTVNIRRLLKEGVEIESIERIVTSKIDEYEGQVTSMEFALDIEAIADSVQPETDKILSNL